MRIDFQTGTFYLGDCFDVMATLPAGGVDMVLCDPPYTMTKRGKSCRPNWMPNGMGDNVFSGKIPLANEWISEIYRMLKDGTHFYTFCNTNDISAYLNAASAVGFSLHNIISMIKDTLMPNRWYLKQVEFVLFFRKGRAKPINDMTSRDWCRVKMPTAAFGKSHITEKPLTFMELLLKNSSEPGQIVFDPFAGSGTTAIAAIQSGRRWICIERDPDYFAAAVARVYDAEARL